MAHIINFNVNLNSQQGAAARTQAQPQDVGRGQAPKRMHKPTIYFAGRMDGAKSSHDWRDGLGGFQGLHATAVNRGGSHLHHDLKIDCGRFVYGGPFTVDTTGGHTDGHCGYFEDAPAPAEHQQIWNADRSWIERADLILAYINDLQAHGTLVEIGYAAAIGKPIALGFSADMQPDDYRELWLCRMVAAKVYAGTPPEVWKKVENDWIRTP